MRKPKRLVLVLSLLLALFTPLAAQVAYNGCWSRCHEMAMMMYERYGMLDAASDAFDGCMDMCAAAT